MPGKFVAIGAALVAIVGIGATYALAQGGSTDTLRACVNETGLMRLVGADVSCKNGEAAVEWNVQGQIGPQGPKGDPGPPGPAGGDPPFDGTIEITGVKQGVFQGPNGPVVDIESLDHQILAPYDAASGQATGKLQHKPLTITKKIDRASPLIIGALVTSETSPGSSSGYSATASR